MIRVLDLQLRGCGFNCQVDRTHSSDTKLCSLLLATVMQCFMAGKVTAGLVESCGSRLPHFRLSCLCAERLDTSIGSGPYAPMELGITFTFKSRYCHFFTSGSPRSIWIMKTSVFICCSKLFISRDNRTKTITEHCYILYIRGAQLISQIVPEIFLEEKWGATVERWGCAPSGVQGQSPWSGGQGT